MVEVFDALPYYGSVEDEELPDETVATDASETDWCKWRSGLIIFRKDADARSDWLCDNRERRRETVLLGVSEFSEPIV